jgi:hypothetical protein
VGDHDSALSDWVASGSGWRYVDDHRVVQAVHNGTTLAEFVSPLTFPSREFCRPARALLQLIGGVVVSRAIPETAHA